MIKKQNRNYLDSSKKHGRQIDKYVDAKYLVETKNCVVDDGKFHIQ